MTLIAPERVERDPGPPPSGTTESPQAVLFVPLDDGGSGSAGLREVIRIAGDSLLANKVRALLTMLGVIIGVAAVVALLAIGGGASTAITGQVAAMGTNLLTIQPGAPSAGGPGFSGQAQTLTNEDAQAIGALNLPLNGLAPRFNGSGQLVAPAADTNATVSGVTPAYQAANNLSLESGMFIGEAHEQGAALVVVLGSSLKTDLFGSGEAVGQTVRLEGQTLQVIGVLAPKGSAGPGGSADEQAFVPLSTAQRRLFGARTPDGNSFRLSAIQLSAISADDLEAIQARVELLLRDRHGLARDGSEDDFRIMNQAEMLSTLTTITSLLTAFLAAVAGISLLVGGIGIMNIMLVSVTERTREIGLRKAVGARGRDILLQFVVEALTLSLFGGLLGLLLGGAIAMAVTLSGLLDAPVSVGSVLLAVGFSTAVGLFFGIYPAQRAARLDPIDALRHE
jgi:putative ABC transport system permease protein